MIEIRRYSNTDKPIWDDFVKRSKNATFLHLRDYMDYHADRFADFSLMAFNHHGKLTAVLPANIVGSTLHSHQGLTYGGWLTPVKHFTAVTMLEVWDAMMSFLKENGIRTLVYKAIPYIYHRYPADEDLYALFRHGAQIAECNMSTAIIASDPNSAFDRRVRRTLRHAEEEGVIFKTLNNPVEILGAEQDCDRAMKCIEMELGEPDASGRRRPVEKKGSEFELDVDTVIMSLGTSPNPLIRSTTPGLETNKHGCIVTEGDEGKTSREGVYAGGDAVTGAATVIKAMGAGKAAAKAMDEYIRNK